MSRLDTIEESGLSDTQPSPSAATSAASPAAAQRISSLAPGDSDDEEFVYPCQATGDQNVAAEPHTNSEVLISGHPSRTQLEAIYAAASSGNLALLQQSFQAAFHSGSVREFVLANDASVRTGLTALHAAASRGHTDIVKWLIEDCGAIPDLEDKEGETALHKAALQGHLDIIKYLLPSKADAHAQDADGWTALHNACSKGYLDVVRWLCESGGAAAEWNGAPGVDIRSKGGWTPLMNAASKGHLPVVLYLLNKQYADPFVRNNWGETAYDIAAAVFEIWICEVLQKAEALRWHRTAVQYDPLAVHTTVPLILFENQRLDSRLRMRGGSSRPKFSASGLGKAGRPAPFMLKLPSPDGRTGAQDLPAWRNDIHLPLRDDPWNLILSHDRPALEGAERSHFWLSDWTLDVTDPKVDVQEGWQYARDFKDDDDTWTAVQPPQLQHLLAGGSVVPGLGAPGPSSMSHSGQSHTWVRRRRWVRVMRRRLDIPPLPFLQPVGAWFHLAEDGTLIPCSSDDYIETGENEGQELEVMPSTQLSAARDYLARAKYLVGNSTQNSEGESSVVDMRRAIAKLERATTELRRGILNDDDLDRRTQAEVLLNAYGRELERRRLTAGAQGILRTNYDEDMDEDSSSPANDSSDEEFRYPGASPLPSVRSRSSLSSRANNATAGQSRPASSRVPSDLTPQLSQAPDFRVPTHEAPQKIIAPGWSPLIPHQLHTWERDEAVSRCRDCQRRFTFLYRRHCRKCGRIFCDDCSSFRAHLEASDVVQDPTLGPPKTSLYRVCRNCHAAISAPAPHLLNADGMSPPEASSAHTDRSPHLSDLADCPVCNLSLERFGSAAEQEAHVRECLEGDVNETQAARYLVYKLPADSVLIGIECDICLEEFRRESVVARLSCLCSFHNDCLSAWLQRGKSCPIHTR